MMMRTLCGGLLLTQLLQPALAADIGKVPVVGGLYHASHIIKEQILDTSTLVATTTRDLTLFTIGGTTLDTYILTLPLDSATKGRVISRLANPMYAIQLGHFLYMFKDRYGGYDSNDVFKAYLKQQYSTDELKRYEHSLFSVDDPVADAAEPEGELINDRLIATLVSLYDALFNNDEWVLGRHLPAEYRYLDDSAADRALIQRVQPLIIGLLTDFEANMTPGEFKHAVAAIIADAAPERAGSVNNKAEAVTITLIDFVRYNVLKNYRQFALEQKRIDAFSDWMQQQMDDDPDALRAFLASQDQRGFAVQVAVDGLQQGLMRALVTPTPTPFITHALANYRQHKTYRPHNDSVVEPEHRQQLNYLTARAEGVDTDPHYLPFFKTLYRTQPTAITEHGTSTTPTISVRNLPIIKTGATVAGPGGTGIPNFHFVDRDKDRAYYFFGNDALQLEKLFQDHGAKTMFDRLPHLKTMNCNAQYDWNAQISYDALVNLGLGEAIRDFGERRCAGELARRAQAEPKIRAERRALIEEIERYQQQSWWAPLSKLSRKQLLKERLGKLAALSEQGMPDYLLMYLPWPDHFAHFKGPFSDEIIAPTGELNRLDYWLGRYTELYQQAGIYDQTLWGMAGDHGLAPIYYALNPEVEVLQALETELGYPLSVRKISSDEGEGPKITNAHHYPSNRELDVVIASTAGGNFMLDLFNARSGWQTQPLYHELTHWTPLQAPEGSRVDLIDATARRLHDSLDYLAVRETPCSPDRCTLRLVGYRDGVRQDEIIQRHGNRLFYRRADNHGQPKLLDVDRSNPYLAPLSERQSAEKRALLRRCLTEATLTQPDSWCTDTQWRTLTQFGPRPDSVNQLAHLYDEDRAGTINLFPKEGVGYNTLVPGRHAGEHYLEKDAFLGFWGTPITSRTPLPAAVNGSLAPTLYQYLTGEPVVAGEQGWGFPSLWPQLQH
ncbi:alkaline phosphatase family protein [Ferrimonas sp. SCSIO 43195]|uniref:alkaline phosphatase family protein n=1 Tax=Ferrimonas sp. SCSIO 43195 TaxID=2822844 RepID=UPI00207549DF|nr:alkaline phosphatase family protein [Ferrimonas sp. SCSIO 43195]USD36574.1 alkaline phosphatase family protein [Ferrimonas sp. SCSIO 43195]